MLLQKTLATCGVTRIEGFQDSRICWWPAIVAA